jgi:uncharacterized HAD superfamily protein
MEKAIIIDLDGTLSNAEKRVHLVKGKEKRFNEFHSQAIHDEPNPWCVEIINKFKLDHAIIILTGRSDDFYEDTEKWLTENNIHFDLLLMRAKSDSRKDAIIKKELYEKKIKPDFEITFAVDDRNQVVDMWREEGIICLQCDYGDF